MPGSRFLWAMEIRVDKLGSDHPLAGPVWGWRWKLLIDGFAVAAGVEATADDAKAAALGTMARTIRGLGGD